jgi:Pentapeptide repeats (8 copies)
MSSAAIAEIVGDGARVDRSVRGAGSGNAGVWTVLPIAALSEIVLSWHTVGAARSPSQSTSRTGRAPGLALLGGGVLLVLALLIFFVLPPAMVTSADAPDMKERLDAQNDIRTTGLQLLGGAVLTLGAYLTWQNVLISREGRSIERQAQITERFSRAVDQLGDDKLPVRLGGIYALERVARDSPQDHYVPVMEVLTAYVRTESVKRTPSADGREPAQTVSKEKKPKTDVQAALAVLGRREAPPDPHAPRLDLEGADLQGARFGKANLENVILRGANLVGAHLAEAKNLERADFEGARFE